MLHEPFKITYKILWDLYVLLEEMYFGNENTFTLLGHKAGLGRENQDVGGHSCKAYRVFSKISLEHKIKISEESTNISVNINKC